MSADGVARGQAVLLLAFVGRVAIFVGITSFLGRTLAPADFGFVALVSILYAVALEFLDMGTTAVATRQVASRPEHERATLTSLLALRRWLAALLFAGVLAFALGGHFAHEEQRWAIGVVSCGIFFLHLTAYQVVFQVRQAYREMVVLSLAIQLGFGIASVAALMLGYGGVGIALLVAVFQVLQAFGCRWVGRRILGYELRAAWRDPGVGALFRAGWMLGIAGVSYKLSAYAGGFFLWERLAPEALATFNAAQRLLAPLNEMAWTFVTPLIAAMSAAAISGDGTFRVQLDAFARLLSGASALVAVSGFFLGPQVLGVMYGHQYASGVLSAVGTFHWLALSCGLSLVTPVLAVAEIARGHTRALMIVALAGLAISLAGNAWFAASYGAEGVAAVVCVSETFVFAALLSRSLAREDIGITLGWCAYLVPALALAAILWALQGSPWWQLAVAAAWVPASLLLMWRLPGQRASRSPRAAGATP